MLLAQNMQHWQSQWSKLVDRMAIVCRMERADGEVPAIIIGQCFGWEEHRCFLVVGIVYKALAMPVGRYVG